MKTNSFSKTIATLCITALAFVLGVSRVQAESWVELHDAVAQLEEAKHSEHPVEHLEKAKFHLEEASRHHKWERAEALHNIREAIDDAKASEHHRMEEHIEKAIHEIHESEK